MGIEVKALGKKYGEFNALQDIHLDIPEGELVALLGPSGSGKTTLLRIIGGMEISNEGSVFFDEEDETNKNIRDRHIGFVFQNYALFRHMTVFENVAFGLNVRPRRSRPSRKEIRNKVLELLKLVQLEGLEKRYPAQLSGGQRQRVALARALAIEPKVLLLDEPFGALDAKVRQELRRWLRQLHRELNITTIFVTHDQEEALEVADRVVIMNKGKIEQIGTPDEIYQQPVNPFVCRFLGQINEVQGHIHQGKIHIGSYTLSVPEPFPVQEVEFTAFIRPHEVRIAAENETNDMMKARIHHVYPVGAKVKVELEVDGIPDLLEAEIGEEAQQQIKLVRNKQVYITFKKARLFTEENKRIDYEEKSTPSTFVNKEKDKIFQIS